MREMKIRLNEVEKLKEFEAIVAHCDFDVDAISTANSRYVIDAKSVMGLFALDLSKPVRIVTYEAGDEVDAFYKEIEKFQ